MATLSNTSNLVVPQKHFSNEQYFYYSLSFFSKVCKKLCNLNNQTIKSLETFLKNNTESGRNTEKGLPYIFTGEELYNTLKRNKTCSEKCQQKNYNTWDDIILNFKTLDKNS